MAIHGRGSGWVDKLSAGTELVAGASRYIFEILVPILIGLFIVAIIALFFVYRQSNQVELLSLQEQLSLTQDITEKTEIQNRIDNIRNWWSQLWNFFETDAFKTIAVSVLLTVLLTALGKIFKIKEAFEERIRTQRQKRIDSQKECVKHTEGMWNELYRMVSEVRFYEKTAEKHDRDPKTKLKDRNKTIKEILVQSENFASEAEGLVNKWHFVFPALVKICEELNENYRKELKKKEKKARSKEELKEIDELIWKCRRPSELFVFCINILYEATLSVAYYIREFENQETDNSNTNEKILQLQNSLGVIQDVIKDMVHQNMLAILKCSLEPQEGYGDKEQHRINKKNIAAYLDTLFDNCIRIRDTAHDILPLPRITDDDEVFKESFLSCMNTMKEHPVSFTAKREEYRACVEFEVFLKGTEADEIVKAWEYKYSEDTLKELAKRLSILSIEEDIKDRTRWLNLVSIIRSN